MIELNGIYKKFTNSKKEILALNNVSMKFETGKFYAIIGPSGSGKSTLLNISGLLDKPTSGILCINGHNTSTLTEKEKNILRLSEIGFVFQECYLNENLTVYENIMLPLLINNDLLIIEKRKIVKDLLNMINLCDRANHFPKELSGGEKQRVAIARALVNNPQMILADEPTGNLDNRNEQIIFNLLKKLSKIGKCVVVVSHSESITKYADKIIYIESGVLRGEER